jgi:hypothetical protein
LFQSIDGKADSAKFVEEVAAQAKQEDRSFEAKRYFCDQDDLICANGRTYAFTNQWGGRSGEAIAALLKAFPAKGVSCRASESI